MKAQTIAKEAIVLLLATLMVVSTFSVANTNQGAPSTPDVSQKVWVGYTKSFDSKDIVFLHYDDGVLGTRVGSSYPPVFMAIRLTNDELAPYNGAKFIETAWYHVVNNVSIPDHVYDAKIWTGDETHPINLLLNDTNLTASGEGWTNHTLSAPITIDAANDYWIVIKCYAHPAVAQNDYPMPFSTNLAGNISHKSKWWHNSNGYTETDFYEVATLNGAWLLRVGVNVTIEDDTPPVTTVQLTGNMSGSVFVTPVTVTLSATDNISGVDYTKVRLDSGNWTTYTAVFTVSALGDHMVEFYSVDKAGNIETTKNATFTIANPLTITITKGFGITAALTNTLTTDMTSVAWNIQCTGGIILFGASASGTIPALTAGAMKKVHCFPFGFGSITITATAGGTNATATAFLLLILTV
jgi:hypothetical protein